MRIAAMPGDVFCGRKESSPLKEIDTRGEVYA